jgi:hypothetical protein
MTDNRVPRGVPTGGQFTASGHAEADVTLASTAPGEDGETLVIAFECENHDAPGACTEECAQLLRDMAGPGPEYPTWDPGRVHEPAPRPYDTFEFDKKARACLRVTHVPEGQVLISTLQPGQWVYVDHQRRLVDSVDHGRRGRTWVDFVGPDREPDGTPSAYFSREFRSYDALPLADPDA